MEYPYVIVRFMATVYTSYRVEFVESDQFQPAESDRAFVVVCNNPYVDGQLTPEATEALLVAVQHASRQSGHRMCAVFGKNDCVYIEPEGPEKPSSQPPSGGAQCLRFPVKNR